MGHPRNNENQIIPGMSCASLQLFLKKTNRQEVEFHAGIKKGTRVLASHLLFGNIVCLVYFSGSLLGLFIFLLIVRIIQYWEGFWIFQFIFGIVVFNFLVYF